jgi:hypothetical protein
MNQKMVSAYYYIYAIQEFYTGKKTKSGNLNINAYESANIDKLLPY